MEYRYAITYLKCQSCEGKSHCRQCADEAQAALLRSGAVEAVHLDFQLKTAALSASDEDAALDALDAAGIFPD